MKAKQWIYISVTILIIIVGVSIYRNYNSIENQSRRMLRDDITEWYYSGISLTHNSPSEPKSQPEKDKAIQFSRVKDQLDESWLLFSEDYKVFNIDYQSAVIDRVYIFESQTNNEKRYYKSRYYYDLGEEMPIPLEKDVSSISNNDYQTLESNRLWYGDFDAFCSSEKQKDMLDSFYNRNHSL